MKHLKPKDYAILEDGDTVKSHGLLFCRKTPLEFVKRPLNSYYDLNFVIKKHGKTSSRPLQLYTYKSVKNLASKGKHAFIPLTISPYDSEQISSYIQSLKKNTNTRAKKTNTSTNAKANDGPVSCEDTILNRMRRRDVSALDHITKRHYSIPLDALTGNKPLHVAIRTGDPKFTRRVIGNMVKKDAVVSAFITRRIPGKYQTTKSPFHVAFESRGRTIPLMETMLKYPNESIHKTMSRLTRHKYAGRNALEEAAARKNGPVFTLLRQFSPFEKKTKGL